MDLSYEKIPISKKFFCLESAKKKNLGLPRMYLKGLKKIPIQIDQVCVLQKIICEYNDLRPFSGTLCSGHI